MSRSYGRTPRAYLYHVLAEFREGRLDVQQFCSDVEHVHNFELNRSELTQKEALAFQELFEKVVWYSPYEEERRRIPNYLGEADIREAADRAAALLAAD